MYHEPWNSATFLRQLNDIQRGPHPVSKPPAFCYLKCACHPLVVQNSPLGRDRGDGDWLHSLSFLVSFPKSDLLWQNSSKLGPETWNKTNGGFLNKESPVVTIWFQYVSILKLIVMTWIMWGYPHDLEKPNIFESSPEHFEPYPTSSIRSAIRPERLVRVDRLVL